MSQKLTKKTSQKRTKKTQTTRNKELEIVYPPLEEIKKFDFKEYCPYYSDYNRKVHPHEVPRKADYVNQLVYIPEKYPGVYRIATYNVHNFVNIYPDVVPARNLDNTLDLINQADLDLIGMQEVCPTLPNGRHISQDLSNYQDLKKLNFDYLKKKMKEIGYKDYFIVNSMLGKNPSTLSDCYYPLANAIFSKTSLKNKKSHSLKGNRSVLFAETTIDSIRILIVCVHLEYTNSNHKENLGPDLIKDQATELVEYINSEQKDRKVSGVILLGDLNNQSNHPSLKLIFNRFSFKEQKNKNNQIHKRDMKDYILLDSEEILNLYSHFINSNHSDHRLLFNDLISQKSDPKIVNSLNRKYFCLKLNKDDYEDYAILKKTFFPGEKYLKIKISQEIIDNSHLAYPEWYATDQIQLLGQTQPYQYHQAIKILLDTYHDNRFKKLYHYSKRLSGYPLNSKNLSPRQTEDLEEILFHYVKTRPNLKTIVLWPTSQWNRKEDLLKRTFRFLKERGKVYYQKKINLNYYQAANLIFHLYMTTSRNKDMNRINFNTEMKGWPRSDLKSKKSVLVIFYEYDGLQEDITGSNAFFKTELRSIYTQSTTKELRNYDILHINDFYSETLDNSSLILNKNSLDVLMSGNVVNLTRILNSKNVYALNSYKKILLKHFSLLEIERLILMSSFVLFTYGLRSFNDLDGTVLYEPFPEDSFIRKYQEWFDITGKNHQPYIDLTLEGTVRYDHFIGVFKDKIAKILGANGLAELILNPKYHYYFFGLKTIILPFELIQKAFRFRPKALVDIIKIGQLTRKKFTIPAIPEVNDDPYYYQPGMTRKQVLATMEYYFLKTYHDPIKTDQIEKFISQTPIKIDTYLDNTFNDRHLFFHKLNYAGNHTFLKELPHNKSSRTRTKRKNKPQTKKNKNKRRSTKVKRKTN